MSGGVTRSISQLVSTLTGNLLLLLALNSPNSNALDCHYCVNAPKVFDCRAMPVGNEDINPKLCLKITARYDNGGTPEMLTIRRGRHTTDFGGLQIANKCISAPLSYLPEQYIPQDATFTSVEVCGCATDYCNGANSRTLPHFLFLPSKFPAWTFAIFYLFCILKIIPHLLQLLETSSARQLN